MDNRVESELALLDGQIDLLHKTIAKLNSQITTIERQNKIAQQTNATLRETNLALESQIAVNKEELVNLDAKEIMTNSAIIELNQQKEELETSSDILSKHITDKSEQLTNLEKDFESLKGQFDKEISMLELKKQDLSQQIMDNRLNDDKIRENLANWQHNLDEKDKNLRIREAKATEQEQSIIRNYNLLNL